MCLSVPQTAAAATRISTSSGRGFGTGHSRMAVPSGPSTGADLTTASMASFGCCIRARTTRLRARTTVSQRLMYEPATPLPSDEAKGLVEKELGGRGLVLHHVRRAPQRGCKTIDFPDQRLCVRTCEEILVKATLHEDQFLRNGGIRIMEPLSHPRWTDFVSSAMNQEDGDRQVADDFKRAEQPSGEEMEGRAREWDTGDVRQVGERRLQNEPVERMPADDLGRDRTAEGVAVKY